MPSFSSRRCGLAPFSVEVSFLFEDLGLASHSSRSASFSKTFGASTETVYSRKVLHFEFRWSRSDGSILRGMSDFFVCLAYAWSISIYPWTVYDLYGTKSARGRCCAIAESYNSPSQWMGSKEGSSNCLHQISLCDWFKKPEETSQSSW